MTKQQQRLDAILRQIPISPENLLIVGSATMVLNGMDRDFGDVDVFCPTLDWFGLYNEEIDWVPHMPKYDDKSRFDPPYLRRIIDGVAVDLFFTWRKRDYGNTDTAKDFESAEIVNGWRCGNLLQLAVWKLEVGRGKDIQDAIDILKWIQLKEND